MHFLHALESSSQASMNACCSSPVVSLMYTVFPRQIHLEPITLFCIFHVCMTSNQYQTVPNNMQTVANWDNSSEERLVISLLQIRADVVDTIATYQRRSILWNRLHRLWLLWVGLLLSGHRRHQYLLFQSEHISDIGRHNDAITCSSNCAMCHLISNLSTLTPFTT